MSRLPVIGEAAKEALMTGLVRKSARWAGAVGILAVCAIVPAVAQAPPAGWKMRVDRSTSASDPDAAGAIKFVSMGAGFHATNPQAATYFNPANTAAGNYSLKANFTLMKPSGHTNFYGLIFGGANLDGANQTYVYFLVAQDGTFLIKHRAGEATHDVARATPNAAVKRPDATGKSTNALEVRVGADKIDYLVNGTVVTSTPKTGMTAKTDGVYGVRVNHLLEVQVDGFALAKM
jgi:uncharacterized iron-regulated membrane protein